MKRITPRHVRAILYLQCEMAMNANQVKSKFTRCRVEYILSAYVYTPLTKRGAIHESLQPAAEKMWGSKPIA